MHKGENIIRALSTSRPATPNYKLQPMNSILSSPFSLPTTSRVQMNCPLIGANTFTFYAIEGVYMARQIKVSKFSFGHY